jgi:hypothetical protein
MGDLYAVTTGTISQWNVFDPTQISASTKINPATGKQYTYEKYGGD